MQQAMLVGPRIVRGVRLLDVYFGEREDWRAKINRSRLDMSCYYTCALGHIFGDFPKGCAALWMNPHSPDPYRHGFNVRDSRTSEAAREYQALNQGWCMMLDGASLEELLKFKIAA